MMKKSIVRPETSQLAENALKELSQAEIAERVKLYKKLHSSKI